MISLDRFRPEERLNQVLAGIHERLAHDSDEEWGVAADELRRLARSRVAGLVGERGDERCAEPLPERRTERLPEQRTEHRPEHTLEPRAEHRPGDRPGNRPEHRSEHRSERRAEPPAPRVSQESNDFGRPDSPSVAV